MFAEFSKLPYLIYHNSQDFTISAKLLRSDLYYDYKNNIKNAWSIKKQKFKDIKEIV